MKKLFLLFFVTCFCCDIFAQDNNKNLEYYNTKLDSIISKYSIETNRIPSYSEVCNFRDANLTEMDRQKIIVKIKKLFEQNRYSNLYSLARISLYKLWQIYPVKNTIKIKQQLIEIFLKYYFYPGQHEYLISSDYSDLSIKNDYTTAAKKRMFDILKGKRSQQEYNANLLFVKSIPEYMNSCERIARQTINKQQAPNDTIFERIKDSLCNEYMLNTAKRMLAEEQIQPNLILMTGFLGMKECIPILQKNLQAEIAENKYHKDTEIAYRFALAKLGDKEQYRYLLDTFIYTHSVRSLQKYLSYFRDDKITWKFIDVSYHSSERIYTSSEDHEGIPSTIFTMDVICPYIKDLPKELNNPHGQPQGMKKYYDWEKRLYEWLMKNRDSVKFNYDVNEGWFWSD